MPRGHKSKIGDVRVAQNGYHYTRTPDGWRLTHHLIAEQKLGRALAKGERAVFADSNRRNLLEDNIQVVSINERDLRKELGQLYVEQIKINKRIELLESQISDLEASSRG